MVVEARGRAEEVEARGRAVEDSAYAVSENAGCADDGGADDVDDGGGLTSVPSDVH